MQKIFEPLNDRKYCIFALFVAYIGIYDQLVTIIAIFKVRKMFLTSITKNPKTGNWLDMPVAPVA
jgi:hypothetical protein